MFKLLICLISATLIAVCMLQLRQQRLQLSYETAELDKQIHNQQARLWNQQIQIASCTAPNAIGQTISLQGLKLVPESEAVSLAEPTQEIPLGNVQGRR